MLKNVSYWISERLKDFPHQSLSEENKKMYCNAFNKVVNYDKKSTVRDHVSGPQHIRNVKAYNKKKKAQQSIHKYAKDMLHVTGTKADCLVYRIMEVCRAFLIDGLPFNLLQKKRNNSIRELLEREIFSGCTRSCRFYSNSTSNGNGKRIA